MNIQDSILIPRFAKLPAWALLPEDTIQAVNEWNQRLDELQSRARELEAIREPLPRLPEREKLAKWEALQIEIYDLCHAAIDHYDLRSEIIGLIAETLDEDVKEKESEVHALRAQELDFLRTDADHAPSERELRQSCQEYANGKDLLTRVSMGRGNLYSLPTFDEVRLEADFTRWINQWHVEHADTATN